MSHKSNTRVYKLKNYGNMTLRVESAPVAQCTVSTVFQPFKVCDIGDEMINLGNSSFSYNCGGFYSAGLVSFKLNYRC